MQEPILKSPTHKSGTISPKNGTQAADDNTAGTGSYYNDKDSQTTTSTNHGGITISEENTPIASANNVFPGYKNQQALSDSPVTSIYTTKYKNGEIEYYGSYDYSSKLSDFKTLGLSLTLLIFSLYLFQVSTRIYRQYFDKKATENYFTPIFFICALLFNIFWVMIVMAKKELPFTFLGYEFLNYPNQFVLGVMLSSLLLFTIGIFRFTLIAFIPNSEDDAKTLKDSRYSFVGIIFGLISALANIVTIWLAFK